MNHWSWIGPLTKAIANGTYQFQIEGRENLPQEGGFIIACNHVTLLDWVFLMAALAPRPVRFLIDEGYTEAPVFKTVIGFSDPIPVCVDSIKPRALKNSMNRVVDALKAGDIVGIFPEGGLTRNGELSKLRPGIEIIAKQSNVCVIPAALTGLWGSIWSRSGGRIGTKLPRSIRQPVTLRFGAPITPDQLTSQQLRHVISSLQYI